MAIALRIIGIIWILISVRTVFQLVQGLILNGSQTSFSVPDLLSILMMVGGLGLIKLKEWARRIILLGSSAYLLLLVGPSLLQGKFGPVAMRNIVFYGIFIAMMLIPQAKQTTKQ